MSEPFAEYIEKEKNREELKRALETTPIRDSWRQYMVMFCFVLVVAGSFYYRTHRFNRALDSLAGQRTKLSAATSAAAVTSLPAGPSARAEAFAPAAAVPEDMHDEFADLENQRALASRLEVVTGSAAAAAAQASPLGGLPAIPKMEPRELHGIANGEDIPLLMYGPGAKAGDTQFRLVTRLPASYSVDAGEFPDIH